MLTIPQAFMRDRLLRMMRRTDALIEADRRLQLRLQRGVVDDVVVRQRLLDHHQVEIVELLQSRRIVQRVGGIRVRHQPDRGETLANAPDHVNIPARFDLHLDALISGGQFALDLLDQLLHRVLNSDRYAAGNLPARAAADLLPQRIAVAPGLQIPHRRFHAAARHVVSANMPAQRVHFAAHVRSRGRSSAAPHNPARSSTPTAVHSSL